MYTPAEYDFTRAIELDPKNTDYRLNRANVRLLTGRKNDAREDLDAMVGQGVPRANLVEWYKKCRSSGVRFAIYVNCCNFARYLKYNNI